MLRDGSTGDWLGTFEGHKGAIWGCALNANGTRAVTGSADFSAKLWDACNGEEIKTFPHNHIVRSVDLSHDSQTLLTASKQCLYLYNLEQPDEQPDKLEAHTANVKACSFIPDNQHLLLSAAEDNNVKLWDLRTRTAIQLITLPAPFGGFEVSRNGRTLSIACGRQARFYSIPQMSCVKFFDMSCPIYSVSLCPRDASFVCGGDDFKIYRFNYETGNEIDSYKGHFGPVHCVRFSPDGELYASGSEDGTIRLWQTNLGKDYGLWKVERPGSDGS